jgi:hypothetical protein
MLRAEYCQRNGIDLATWSFRQSRRSARSLAAPFAFTGSAMNRLKFVEENCYKMPMLLDSHREMHRRLAK